MAILTWKCYKIQYNLLLSKNNINEDLIYFQQNEEPSPHYVLHMSQFLIPTFYWEKRSNRMTGKSPDLTFSTFCFEVKILKNICYF